MKLFDIDIFKANVRTGDVIARDGKIYIPVGVVNKALEAAETDTTEMNGDLISRSALMARCNEIADCEWNHRAAPISWADAYETFADMVEDAPAVDAVEVVRCKDCERRDKTADLTNDILCPYMEAIMPKNAFCSYGERRADYAD